MLPYRDSRVVRTTLIIFFILAALYALYEAQGMLYGPVISVPTETVTAYDAYTSIRGKAERITELRLNGQPIAVTEEGEFNEPYLLAPGSNRIILDARDARGRTARKILDIIYIESSGSHGQNQPISSPATSSATTTATE